MNMISRSLIKMNNNKINKSRMKNNKIKIKKNLSNHKHNRMFKMKPKKIIKVKIIKRKNLILLKVNKLNL